VEFVEHWSKRAALPANRLLGWLELSAGRYHRWKAHYGQGNRHNAPIPRHFWLLEWERQAIVRFALEHPLEGYRRLSYMMLDADVVAVSPSSVYRVLKGAGVLRRQAPKASRKGSGFQGPHRAHQHWHIDISYLNIAGTFYYLCSLLDGYSRYIVHWEIREQMLERDIEVIVQRAREKYPQARPRIISDNGPQFIAKDFKEFIRLMGMTHVRTSPFYPQSNGKLERWHQSLKAECIRPNTPVSLDDARRLVQSYVTEYNDVRLHSAIGYIAPRAKLEGREVAIFTRRRERLQAAATRRAEACERQRYGKAA
jgi:transposase InsO family protein